MKEFFAVTSLVLGFATFVPYYAGIWKGTVKPHLFSWIPWTLTTAVGFWASLSHGGGYGSWLFALQAVLCLVVLVYAIFRGEKEITVLDRAAFVGSVLAVIIYIFTKDAIISILLAATADCLGFVPTFRKSYKKPREEPISTYALSGTSFAFSIAAVSMYTFETVFYAGILVAANFLFVLFALYRRSVLRTT